MFSELCHYYYVALIYIFFNTVNKVLLLIFEKDYISNDIVN